MSLVQWLPFFGVNAAVVAVAQVIGSIVIKAKLENSIRHSYERKLADYQRETEMRDRAAMVAELFTEWATPAPDWAKLQQLAWEAELWLPPDLVRETTKRLCNASDAAPLNEILVKVRKHLHGADDPIAATDIVFFNLGAADRPLRDGETSTALGPGE